jgi:D-alanyl-D-alanine endopeptidase (penicillin-binding protein 7)
MRKTVLGRILIPLIAFFLALPDATALTAKSGTAYKSSKKKTGPKRKIIAAHAKRKAVRDRDAAKPPTKFRKQAMKKGLKARGKRKLAFRRIPHSPHKPPVMTAGELAGLNLTQDPLMLSSNVAFVLDQLGTDVLFEKNSGIALPVASITKLMTGLVVVEAGLDMDALLELTDEDAEEAKHTLSKLHIGMKLPRAVLLRLALMSSENRAAAALGRNYPGGLASFVAAMNAKAQALGMTDTQYVDSTGLSNQNVASARDLAKLVVAALAHPLLGEYSTTGAYMVDTGERMLRYVNTNRLIGHADWQIGLQKTGYLSTAGRCMVMQVRIGGRPVVMVFLDSKQNHSRFIDASRLRDWVLEQVKKFQGMQAQGMQAISHR